MPSQAPIYTGGCHCGTVRFQAEITLDSATACNCSICSKMGYLLSFVPAANFLMLSGEDALKDYQFGKKTIHHVFCQTCGTHAFARGSMPDGTPMMAINIRCLDEIDPQQVPHVPFDGKSL